MKDEKEELTVAEVQEEQNKGVIAAHAGLAGHDISTDVAESSKEAETARMKEAEEKDNK